MKRTLLIVAVLFCAAPARAQQSAEDRFRSLPAEKQEELRRRFRELQSLPPAERAELRRSLERLDAMPFGPVAQLPHALQLVGPARRKHELRSLAAEGHGQRLADSRRRARDPDHLVAKSHRT